MPVPVFCQGCNQVFKSIQYFQQHLEAKRYCADVFVERDTPKPNGLSRPNARNRFFKKCMANGLTVSEFIVKAERLIEEEAIKQAAIKEAMVADGRAKVDFSDFEFTEEDENPSPQKRIRVGELKNTSYHGDKCKNTLGEAVRGCLRGGDIVLDRNNDESNRNDDHVLCGDDASGDGILGSNQRNVHTANHNNDRNDATARTQGTNDETGTVNITTNGNVNEGNEIANKVPDEGPMNQFKEYIEHAKKDYRRFSPAMVAAIELMDLMNKKGGSVALYDEIFKWHLDHRSVYESIPSDQLHKKLVERNNLGPTLPFEKTVVLPHSKETLHIPCHDAKAMHIDLLTDPRWTDHDFLFHNDDPYADPPEEFTKVGDVNTGLAHRKTWEALIQPEPYTPCGRKKIPYEVIMYIDGTNTGNFGNCSLEILKFTTGMLKGKSRTKSHAWRNLGYVKKVYKRSKKAEDNLRKSQHIENKSYVKDPSYRSKQFMQARRTQGEFDWELFAKQQNGGTGNANANRRRRKRKRKTPEIKPQDFHAILETILESYKTIEDEGGLPFDKRYKGKLYRLLLMPYIIFVKADSVEANKVCGAYGCNLQGVGCICRMCCIPTEDTDKPYIEPEPARKTQHMILNLVREDTKEAKDQLRKISQHELWNCFYRHQFGLHNNAGIHGATPMEALHWIQLCQYKYDREALFLQTGETSKLSDELDALTQTFGICLERQSDRTLPRTKFAEGIRGGKMQAHEMTGVILLLTLSLRSRAGRNLLLNKAWGRQKEFFNNEDQIRNWIRMLETHLMFEQWLRKEEHEVHLLERAKTKVKEMMCLTKHVGQRSKGMEYKTENFHTTVHMPQLALELCAPIHWNTECNESHHKPDKKTAHRTSRHLETFDISVAVKVCYHEAVTLAMEEIRNGVRRWDYYDNDADPPIPEPTAFAPILTGPSLFWKASPVDDNAEEITFVGKMNSKMNGKESYHYDQNTREFIASLSFDLYNDNGIESIHAFGTLKLFSKNAVNNSQLFHAMPYYRGRAWNDWAIFDLSDPSSDTPTARRFVPAQIKCFLDFRGLPENNALLKPPGIYAIIEPTKPNANVDEIWWSDLWEPVYKEPCVVPGFENDYNKQELVSTTKILHPTVVVPDHENQNKRAYLRMISKEHWAGMFDNWLEEDHEREFE